jgi:putative endonuclease
MTKHYVYVLRSLADRQFYVGLTNDLPTRTQSHNLGLVPSTKRRGPFELVYWEGCLNRGDAAQREKSIQRAFHSQARPIQHMSVFHRRRYVPLPREIVSEAVLDITLAPGAFQIRLPLRGVLLAEASLPIDQFEGNLREVASAASEKTNAPENFSSRRVPPQNKVVSRSVTMMVAGSLHGHAPTVLRARTRT